MNEKNGTNGFSKVKVLGAITALIICLMTGMFWLDRSMREHIDASSVLDFQTSLNDIFSYNRHQAEFFDAVNFLYFDYLKTNHIAYIPDMPTFDSRFLSLHDTAELSGFIRTLDEKTVGTILHEARNKSETINTLDMSSYQQFLYSFFALAVQHPTGNEVSHSNTLKLIEASLYKTYTLENSQLSDIEKKQAYQRIVEKKYRNLSSYDFTDPKKYFLHRGFTHEHRPLLDKSSLALKMP